jgi:tRNA uridine 5-carbamoylmethylation protein Kti12
MKKYLLILQGPTQSGKTSSIKMALHQLHLMEPELEYRGKNWVECLEVLKLKEYKVGITSRSDKFSSLEQNLRFLSAEHNCDFIICAANEMMKGVKNLILDFAEHGWEIVRIQKYPIFFSRENKENQNRLNKQAAEKLVEKFNHITSNQ